MEFPCSGRNCVPAPRPCRGKSSSSITRVVFPPGSCRTRFFSTVDACQRRHGKKRPFVNSPVKTSTWKTNCRGTMLPSQVLSHKFRLIQSYGHFIAKSIPDWDVKDDGAESTTSQTASERSTSPVSRRPGFHPRERRPRRAQQASWRER